MVQEMLGHSSIVLTADTYTSVLPKVAHTAAEQTATHVLRAGGRVPGTKRRRRPSVLKRGPAAARSGERSAAALAA
ncbi:hypothetical protein [Actinomadura sp. 3N407]|uniref:hypothetical protein n=1 Tax=Actinomadura sp. 3N407 TaxID=3457423 RepID=UPI003FCCBEF7